jgi:HK97 family phage major capsid protein
MTRDELRAELAEARSRVQEIDSAYAGQYIDPDTDDGREWAERNERIDELNRTLEQLERREERLRELADEPANREDGTTFHTPRPNAARGEDIFDLSTVRSSISDPSQQRGELRDRARRAIEMSRPRHPGIDADTARSNVERLVEENDTEDGRFARYLLAVGSPAYRRAFGHYLQRGDASGMSREEQAAWQLGQTAERALSLTGATGGFAVPFELDPTILNTSNGVVNPIRQIANVEQITVDEWRGVSSTGITASYAAEATETTDNSPTLVQPTISTEKAQAFIPFSIEVGQDWSGLQGQMAELLADAKDTLEAAKFVNGTGTNEPFGVLTGTTNTVNAAAGADAFTLANLYALVGALPPRYRARGAFIGDLLILNRIRQFDTVGSPAAIWADTLQADVPARLLGKPAYEASAMPDDATTGNKFLVFGDFSRYKIVDRVGLTVEVIPHLFGTNQRPTGQRGLYAYWRNGAKVVDGNAFRAILGTA